MSVNDNSCASNTNVDVNVVCAKFIEENDANIWIIKVLFSGIIVLLLIFYIHYWMAVQKKVDLGKMARELLTEKHKTIMLESTISAYKKELINSNNNLLTLQRSLILNGTIESIEEVPLDSNLKPILDRRDENVKNTDSGVKLETIAEDFE